MILAVESCHKFGFIPSDVKPDVRSVLTAWDSVNFARVFVQNFLFDHLNIFPPTSTRIDLHWAHDTCWWPYLPSIGTIFFKCNCTQITSKSDCTSCGIDLEDSPQGDGSRTKRLDRKIFRGINGRRWSEEHIHGGRRNIEENDQCPRAHQVFSSSVVPCTCQLAHSVWVKYPNPETCC